MNTRFSPTSGIISWGCVAALVASMPLAASDRHPCASITSDVDRLACYDAAFGADITPSNGAQAPSDFGLPARKPVAAKDEKKETSDISAVVASAERRPDGRFVVRLDNGQTWAQSETDSRIEVQAGDTVTVRRAALGSYLLSNRDGIATRVKRLR